MRIGLIAVGVAGGLLLLIALCDVFVTIFNYDGFTFVSPHFHRVLWQGLCRGTGWLPAGCRASALSLGSAAMLPVTLLAWLAVQISAFALMYLPGLATGAFRLSGSARPGLGTAFYFSAGDITSLTFGDVIPRSGFYQGLVVVETMVGLATVGLAVTYVLAALDALGSLNTLHGRVRRQATEPNRPVTVLGRFFHGGLPDELGNLLQSLAEDLEGYDQGLRRYPVVFYFHTRRPDRSIPRIFTALGDLIELVRWGLPTEHQLTRNPYLLALADEYTSTVQRLQRSFLGSAGDSVPAPQPEAEFWADYCRSQPVHPCVATFRSLQDEASAAAGLDLDPRLPAAQTYQRYGEWLPFHYRRRDFIGRVAEALGYG